MSSALSNMLFSPSQSVFTGTQTGNAGALGNLTEGGANASPSSLITWDATGTTASTAPTMSSAVGAFEEFLQNQPLNEGGSAEKQPTGDSNQILAACPILAFLTGKLDLIKPEEIASRVSSNKFIQDALAHGDVQAFMNTPQPSTELIKSLGFGKLGQSMPGELKEFLKNSAEPALTPKDFLKKLGMDPSVVSSELEMLKSNLTLEGLSSYVARAQALQENKKNPKASQRSSLEKIAPSTTENMQRHALNAPTSSRPDPTLESSIGVRSSFAEMPTPKPGFLLEGRNNPGAQSEGFVNTGFEPSLLHNIERSRFTLPIVGDGQAVAFNPGTLGEQAILQQEIEPMDGKKTNQKSDLIFAEANPLPKFEHPLEDLNFREYGVVFKTLGQTNAGSSVQDLGFPSSMSPLRPAKMDVDKSIETLMAQKIQASQADSSSSTLDPVFNIEGGLEVGIHSALKENGEISTDDRETLLEKQDIGEMLSSHPTENLKSDRTDQQVKDRGIEGPSTPMTSVKTTNDLVEKIKDMKQANQRSLVVGLDHKEMGKVEIAIDMSDNNKIGLRVLAGSDHAKELLKSELPSLRENLLSHNLDLKTFDIGVRRESQNFGQPQQGSSGQDHLRHAFQDQSRNGGDQQKSSWAQSGWSSPRTNIENILKPRGFGAGIPMSIAGKALGTQISILA